MNRYILGIFLIIIFNTIIQIFYLFKYYIEDAYILIKNINEYCCFEIDRKILNKKKGEIDDTIR